MAASDFRALEAHQSPRNGVAGGGIRGPVRPRSASDLICGRAILRIVTASSSAFRCSLVAALIFGGVQAVGLVLRRRRAGAAFGACPPADPRRPQHQMVLGCGQRDGDRGAHAGAARLPDGRSRAECFCDRPRPCAFRDLRNSGAGRSDGSRGDCRACIGHEMSHISRLRYPHHDDDRGDGRRNRDAVGFRLPMDVLRRIRSAGGTKQQRSRRRRRRC